ncbi:MAG: hypothetical protein IKE31_05730 [Eubacterium sp.]|nr:hypothetical protein [Eubacterium sp.]
MDNILIPVILMVLIIVIFLILNKVRTSGPKDKYDERQTQLRGKAYKVSASVMGGCGIFYYIATSLLDVRLVEDGVLALIIVCIGIAAFSAYAVLNDCFFDYSGRKGGNSKLYYLIILSIVVIVNAVVAVRQINENALIKNGLLTGACASLVLSATFLAVIVAMGIKYLIDRKAEVDDK